MNSSLLFVIVLWGYMLSVFRRTSLVAFYYIWGSVGLFFILITLANPYWVWELTQFMTNIVGVTSQKLNIGQTFTQYGGVLIYGTKSTVFLTIDYECSGTIEIAALISLLIFFPVYSRKEKLFYSILGFVGIGVSNIIRLAAVVVIVHTFGNGSFFLAHSIIGRIIFYILTIIIYYYIFTYSQIDKGIYKQTIDMFRKGIG